MNYMKITDLPHHPQSKLNLPYDLKNRFQIWISFVSDILG